MAGPTFIAATASDYAVVNSFVPASFGTVRSALTPPGTQNGDHMVCFCISLNGGAAPLDYSLLAQDDTFGHWLLTASTKVASAEGASQTIDLTAGPALAGPLVIATFRMGVQDDTFLGWRVDYNSASITQYGAVEVWKGGTNLSGTGVGVTQSLVEDPGATYSPVGSDETVVATGFFTHGLADTGQVYDPTMVYGEVGGLQTPDASAYIDYDSSDTGFPQSFMLNVYDADGQDAQIPVADQQETTTGEFLDAAYNPTPDAPANLLIRGSAFRLIAMFSAPVAEPALEGVATRAARKVHIQELPYMLKSQMLEHEHAEA